MKIQKVRHFETAVPCRPFVCTVCGEDFDLPEDLGAHIERHRPVKLPVYSKRGKLLSVPCPKGCGRHFKRAGRTDHGNLEYSEHIVNCDGSPPIQTRRVNGSKIFSPGELKILTRAQ